jgi:hypothetical protein
LRLSARTMHDSADTLHRPSPLSHQFGADLRRVQRHRTGEEMVVAGQVAPTRRLHMLRRAPACCSRHTRMAHEAPRFDRTQDMPPPLGRVASAQAEFGAGGVTIPAGALPSGQVNPHRCVPTGMHSADGTGAWPRSRRPPMAPARGEWLVASCCTGAW